MTGENPLFPVQSPGGNEGLKRDLKALKAPFEEMWGKYGGVPERSLLIYGLPREHLYALGQKYGQESVIHSEGGQHQFIYTNGPKTGQMHVGNTHEHWPPGTPPPEDFYTDVPGVGALRLGFDFENLHSAVPPSPALAAPPISKHELGHALYRTLTDVLKKADASGFSHVASGAGLNPSRELHHEAADYARKAGLPPPGLPPYSVDEGFLQRAAQTYEGLQHTPNDPDVKRAYDALKRETLAQYHHLLGKGYRFSAASGNVTPASFDPNGPQSFAYSGDEVAPPYAGDYNKLYDDITKNKHLHVFTGSPPPADHPLAEAVPGGGSLPTYNDVFRAVHDVFGHAKAGSDFGHHGEDHTYHSHASMYSSLARRALATETRGQNSAFHYGANGAHNRANPAQAIYPDQKATLMPDEFVHPTPTSNPNLTGVSVQKSEGSTAVADHEKNALSVNDALRELHKLTKAQVESYEQQCIALRKAETAALEKKAPPGWSEETMHKLKAKHGTESAFKIAWAAHNKHGDAKKAELALKAEEGRKCAQCDEPSGEEKFCGEACEKQYDREAKGDADYDRDVDDGLDKGSGYGSMSDPENQKSHVGNPRLGKAGVTDGGMGGSPSAPATNLGEMAMAEDAQLEAYAKGEYKPMAKAQAKTDAERRARAEAGFSRDHELAGKAKDKQAASDASAAFSREIYEKRNAPCPHCKGSGKLHKEEICKAELCKACGMSKNADHDCDKAERYAKGEYQPAGAQPDGPQPKKGVLPGDKKPKEQERDLDEGSGGQIKKGKLKKAGLAPAAGAPKAPSAGGAAPSGAPKLGGLPKAPKLPGPAKPGMTAKPPQSAGGKPPAMGAGQPNLKSELAKAGPPALPGVKGPAPNKEVGGLLNELRPKAPPPPVHSQFDISDEGPMKPGPAGPAPSKVALSPKDPALAGGLAKLPGVKGPAGRPGAAAQPGIASTRPAEQLPQKMGAPVVGKTIAMQSLAAPPAAGRAAPPAIPGAAAAAPAPAKKPGIFGRLGAMMGKAEDDAGPKCEGCDAKIGSKGKMPGVSLCADCRKKASGQREVQFGNKNPRLGDKK